MSPSTGRIATDRIATARPAGLQLDQAFNVDSFAARHGGVTRSAFKAGVRVYSQGAPADAIFYIQHGQIQLSVLSDQGKEAIIGILDAGDFCGEACLIGERQQVSTATCLENSSVARLERTAVMQAIHADSHFAGFYLVYNLNRGVMLRDSLISHLFYSSEGRLARTLLLLADSGGDGGADNVIGKIDQEALAQMVGTTRSRVNHFMTKFRKLGYIDYNGHSNRNINVRSALLNAALRDNLLGGTGDPASASHRRGQEQA
jgi:CRP-like cAMP-binding protein